MESNIYLVYTTKKKGPFGTQLYVDKYTRNVEESNPTSKSTSKGTSKKDIGWLVCICNLKSGQFEHESK